MPTKTIKEIVTDISGNTTIEFSDDSLQKFNVKDTATYSTDSNGNVVGLVGPCSQVDRNSERLDSTQRRDCRTLRIVFTRSQATCKSSHHHPVNF